MSRFRGQYSVLDSKWGLNNDNNEVVGLRLLYMDAAMYRPFQIELLRGDVENKRLAYAHILERAADAHLAYQLFQSYGEMFFENTTELDPKDHPFIARFIREKEISANKRYHPGSDWRYRYGMPPIIFGSSFMRYFNTNPIMSTIGWLILAGGAILGIWVAL